MKSIDPLKINKLVDTFIAECSKLNKGTQLHPVYTYVPLSATAKKYHDALKKTMGNDIVGQLALEQMNDLSLLEALYKIIQIHDKLTSTVNIKAAAKNVVVKPGVSMALNPSKWAFDIIKTPEQYASRQKQIPANITSKYNNVTVGQIVEIAVAFRAFYTSEKTAATYNTENTEDTENSKQEIKFDMNEYVLFVKNELEEFTANGKKQKSPNLSEGMSYKVGDVRKINTQEAKDVIKKLEGFVGYIREGEPTNWMSKATNALNRVAQGANALKLGT